jgi:hypothetical protein
MKTARTDTMSGTYAGGLLSGGGGSLEFESLIAWLGRLEKIDRGRRRIN